MIQDTIISDPPDLEFYLKALTAMGIEIIGTKGLPNINGEENYRYEIHIKPANASQLFCAGQLVTTYKQLSATE